MTVFELVLGLLVAGVGLALLAPRLGLPWPALLALAGAALAFVPGIPQVTLEPDLALALFLAPVLMDSAYDASPRDLRDNWGAVSGLVLVAVALTVIAVAVTARWLEPDMSWAVAVALGAIVAPPDAAAASAVLRQVRLPHRVVVILEGESLLNDASALLIYRFAVGAAIGGVTLWTVPVLVLALVGGVALGWLLARAYLAVAARVEDGAAAVLLQFLGTFGVWLLADALDLSAVLTVVAFAVTLARFAPGRMSALQRRSSYAVWDVVVFVLNVLAFILVGLQLRGIMGRMDGNTMRTVTFGAAVLGVTILVRFAWVMIHSAFLRRKARHPGAAPGLLAPTIRGGLAISWCGMRGIVTIAAALALPESFPHRDLIVFAAFSVVLGTLVLQGMTLRPLLATLALPHDESVADEAALARVEVARAALAVIGPDRTDIAARILVKEYEARLVSGGRPDADETGRTVLRRQTLAAERDRLMALRREGLIGEDAFHVIEEELDWAEVDGRTR